MLMSMHSALKCSVFHTMVQIYLQQHATYYHGALERSCSGSNPMSLHGNLFVDNGHSENHKQIS